MTDPCAWGCFPTVYRLYFRYVKNNKREILRFYRFHRQHRMCPCGAMVAAFEAVGDF